MHKKRIIGLVLFIIGIGLLIFSIYAMNRISTIKGQVSETTSLFSKDPFGKAVGGKLMQQAASYDTLVKGCLLGGIIITLIGGGMFLFCRHRR